MRLFVLLGLGTLDLGGTGEGLHAVLALLACGMDQYWKLDKFGILSTYAAVWRPSRSWWPCQHGPDGSGARTSSWPRWSRR